MDSSPGKGAIILKEKDQDGNPLEFCFGIFILDFLTVDLKLPVADAKKIICKFEKSYAVYQENKSNIPLEFMTKDIISCVKDSTTAAVEEILSIIFITIFIAVLSILIIAILYSFAKSSKNRGSNAGFAILGGVILLVLLIVAAFVGISRSTTRSKRRDNVCLSSFEEKLLELSREDEAALAKALCLYPSFEGDCKD